MLACGTTTFECKSGYGLSREGELRALELARTLGSRVAQTTTSTALLAHSVRRGYSADEWMDEVETMMPEVVALGKRLGARHLRRVDRVLQRAPDTDGRSWRPTPGSRCAATSSSSAGMRSVPVALAAGRSVGRPPVDAARRRHRAAGAGRVRGGAAARGGVPRRRAPRSWPGAGRRGRDRRARDRCQPRHSARVLAAARDRTRRQAVRLQRPRGARGRDVERRLDARVADRSGLDRGRQARRPTACSMDLSSGSPTASGTTRYGRRSSPASRCTSAMRPAARFQGP